jgi:uncharacterized damage-inducible protein DinB
MDLLDRLLGHDAWTTRQLLLRCDELNDAQLDQLFDIGHGSLRETLSHMVDNLEIWTALLRNDPILPEAQTHSRASIPGLLARWESAYTNFANVAWDVRDNQRYDELWLDTLDTPPQEKSYGGAILHVITHNMHHRGELLHMLARLDVRNLPEGDLLGWEAMARAGLT